MINEKTLANTFVLDANIAVKVLFEEFDSDLAQTFLDHCLKHHLQLFVPEHFLYELLHVCRVLEISISDVLLYVDMLKVSGLQIISPKSSTWLLAEEITKQGSPTSGFPAMYDAIYHAIAIESEAVFLTADKKHFAKAKSFGSISLLENWTDCV